LSTKEGGVLPRLSKSSSCASLGSIASSIASSDEDCLCEGLENVDIDVEEPIKVDMSQLKKTSKLKRSGSNGKMKKSGSNSSIKEFLPIGAICEDTELRNEVFSFSSDEESSSGDDSDDDESMCSDAVSVATSSTMGSAGYAILDILKKSDSRDHIGGNGHRLVKSCDVKKSLSDDPLINLYLRRSRLTTNNKKSMPSMKKSRAVNNQDKKDAIENILMKSDSRDHINNRGKRVVKSCAKTSPLDDPLITRYLNKSKESSNDDEDATIENALLDNDSHHHIKGKGKRVVHSRSTKKSTDDPLIKRYLDKSRKSNDDARIESILTHSDSRDHIKGRGNRVVHSRAPKVSPNGLSLTRS
jgi:hypothetical protein